MRKAVLTLLLLTFVAVPAFADSPTYIHYDKLMSSFKGLPPDKAPVKEKEEGFDDTAEEPSSPIERIVAIPKKMKLSAGFDFGSFLPLSVYKNAFPPGYAVFGIYGLMPLPVTLRKEKLPLILMGNFRIYRSRDPMTQFARHLRYTLIMPSVGIGIDLLPSMEVVTVMPTFKLGMALESEYGQQTDWTSPTGYRSYTRSRFGWTMTFGASLIFRPLPFLGAIIQAEFLGNYGGRNLMYAMMLNFGAMFIF